MNRWRRLAVLCTGGLIVERGFASGLGEAGGPRAPSLFGLIRRRRRGPRRQIAGLRGAASSSDFGDLDFAPDTDILVFYLDDDEPGAEDAVAGSG